MSIQFKFSGAARVTADISPVALPALVTVPGFATSKKSFTVSVATLGGAQSLVPASGRLVPAVIQYSKDMNVFNELSMSNAPADSTGKTAGELASEASLRFSVLVVGGSGANLTVVFLDEGTVFPATPPIPIPKILTYSRDLSQTAAVKAAFPALFPQTDGADSPTDPTIGQLLVGGSATPYSLNIAEGNVIVDLEPHATVTYSLGTAVKRFLNYFGVVVDASEKVKTPLIELGGAKITGGVNTVIGAVGDTIIPLVPTTDTAAERTLITVAQAVSIAQRKTLSGVFTVVAGGQVPPVYTLPGTEGLPVPPDNSLYPYADGSSGDALHIAEFTPGVSCTLWAESLSHLNLFYVGPTGIVPAVGDFANASINYFGTAEPETSLSASAGTVTIAAEANGWYSAAFTPQVKITTIAEMTAILRAAVPGIIAYTTKGVIVTPELITGSLQAQQIHSHGIVQSLNNLTAITDPTADDDEDKGYSIGSLWQDNTTGFLYRASGITAGAAVWVKANQLSPVELWKGSETAGTFNLIDGNKFSDYSLLVFNLGGRAGGGMNIAISPLTTSSATFSTNNVRTQETSNGDGATTAEYISDTSFKLTNTGNVSPTRSILGIR